MRPTFNRDCLYYTPSFQNDEDKILNQYDKEVHFFLHKERIRSECTEIDEKEIMRPKPSQKNHYCKVCQERF